MTDDLNRKSLRQFQCRDYLWEAFEQMSQELECSVDYLVNEAMRHYARAQGKLRQTTAAPNAARPAVPQNAPVPPPSPAMAPLPPPRPPAPPLPPAMRQGAPPPLNPANGMQRSGVVSAAPGGYPAPAPQRMPPMPQAAYPQQQGFQPPAPQPQRSAYPAAAPSSGGAVLYAMFEGQRVPVAKDEFFIGRSNKNCDLIVKDPNVSRQHARIVRHGGQFWMLDMGSTNGIEFQGGRVDRHVISEGDVFKICDHEISFTYR